MNYKCFVRYLSLVPESLNFDKYFIWYLQFLLKNILLPNMSKFNYLSIKEVNCLKEFE